MLWVYFSESYVIFWHPQLQFLLISIRQDMLAHLYNFLFCCDEIIKETIKLVFV